MRTISGVWIPFARASSRTPRASEPWLRSSSPLRATHWPLYSRPCALSHSRSGIRPEFVPEAETSVIVNRTCCLSCSDRGSSGRKSPSSNIASACRVTISFYRDKSGSSCEVTDCLLGGSRATRRVLKPRVATPPLSEWPTIRRSADDASLNAVSREVEGGAAAFAGK